MRRPVNEALAAYVPVDAVETVSQLLREHGVLLKISRDRLTKLGDFKPSANGSPHRISINGNLNIYEFLLVFFHELAHLMVYVAHGRRATPHGKEWKKVYGSLIRRGVEAGYFHSSVCSLLTDYSYRVKACGVAATDVVRALQAFDRQQEDSGWQLLDEIAENEVFITRGGRVFRKREKLRTRYRCLSVDDHRVYLLHGAAKVKLHGSTGT